MISNQTLAGGTTDDSGAVSLKVDAARYPPPLAVFLEAKKAGYLDTLAHLSMPRREIHGARRLTS